MRIGKEGNSKELQDMINETIKKNKSDYGTYKYAFKKFKSGLEIAMTTDDPELKQLYTGWYEYMCTLEKPITEDDAPRVPLTLKDKWYLDGLLYIEKDIKKYGRPRAKQELEDNIKKKKEEWKQRLSNDNTIYTDYEVRGERALKEPVIDEEDGWE